LMVDEIIKDTKSRMASSVNSAKSEMAGIRAGRASPGMLDSLKIDAYGQKMNINQLGNVTTPDSRTINIDVWDQSNVTLVEKSIRESDLGINPAVDGEVIKLSIPPLSEERRQELSKIVKQKVEQSLVAIRNIRRTVIDQIKSSEKNSEISQDESKRMQQDVQSVTDLFVADMNKAGESKQTDILNI